MTSVLNHAQQVGEEIVARVQTLTVAQGAETDIGGKVFRGVRNPDRTQMPCTVVVEGDDMPSRAHQHGFAYKIVQRYGLLAYLPCDVLNPNLAAHAAIRDLQRCIFQSVGRLRPDLGGTVKTVDYVGKDIAPRSQGEDFVVAAIEIEVVYAMDISNP
jgi:hypothetical protein